MESNVLTKFVINIPADTLETIRSMPGAAEYLINGFVGTVDKVYSFIIFAIYDGGVLTSFRVEYMISQTERFNTISHDEFVAGIIDKISKYDGNISQRVIGYQQAPLELLIDLFEPLVKKLANKQKSYWEDLDYEDLCQMCRLTICTLYNGGYYIHKSIVEKSFVNSVLMSMRKERFKPVMLSLDEPAASDSEGNSMTICDTIIDERDMLDRQDEEDREYVEQMNEQKRDIVIEFIGKRQYDQLVREYRNKQTTNWSRRLLIKIKEYVRSLGLDGKSFGLK